MTLHMSARLAWHMDGWNGHVCQNPAANTYCVGSHSYPGEMIAERRNLPLEMADAGKCCTKIKHIPACCYSINAFGSKTITAFAAPPAWWNDEAAREEWELPPATMCVWPYEQMYGPKVTNPDGRFNYEKRLGFAREYFAQFKPSQSLVFYYANYSNPLNQEDCTFRENLTDRAPMERVEMGIACHGSMRTGAFRQPPQADAGTARGNPPWSADRPKRSRFLPARPLFATPCVCRHAKVAAARCPTG